MPFIGRDWRSPGEAWVKTESLGWQRMKIIESQLYPSCHQNPACSWPPRSDFGQHMVSHCRGHEHSDRNSSEFRGSLSSSSSDSGSSRGGSMSPSPTGSPEKSIHHLHPPITISSPYGQYSCCAHHFEVGSPPTKNNNFDDSRTTKMDNNNSQMFNAQTMSRSLSRESVQTISSPTVSSPKLRYNSSVSDFRNSTTPTSEQQATTTTNSFNDTANNNSQTLRATTEQVLAAMQPIRDCSSNLPTLMRNGSRLGEAEFSGSSEHMSSLSCLDASKSSPNGLQGSCCCSAASNQSPSNVCHPKEPYVRTAPHCRISVRTREVAMYNTISEAFYRLDFCNAIHDIRRFNYICKLLHLLITQNLTSLSGCATKVLFTMLEQVAWEVSSNKRNIHVLKNLLNELRQMIQKYYCWGRPIGSSQLWRQHFDTIKRISQIVDGIELAPAKSDSAQMSFNNLPVEMIREILLRLNDYRDLVNSAQASPVMRSMIDGQYIWHQLCRYHFTEQQMKMAIEDYNFSKKRGVKYARTASADGRTSFRNPVTHKSKSSPSSSSSSPTTTTTTPATQQPEQTGGGQRRNSRQRAGSNEEPSDSSSPSLPPTRPPSSSYVTQAIRIFDKEGSSITLGGGSNGRVGNERAEEKENIKRAKQQSMNVSNGGQNLRLDKKDREVGQQNRPLNTPNRSSHEIDWERVFHQLRKKFDLKEEYADCLLLCRHCRCLFWKSFGHPCIKSDDSTADSRPYSQLRLDQSCSMTNNSEAGSKTCCSCDGARRQNSGELSSRGEVDSPPSGNRPDQAKSRLSVAILSRNFDNRAERIRIAADSENLPPTGRLQGMLDDGNSAQRQQLHPHGRRAPNDNLNPRFREHNFRVSNRRMDGRNQRNNNSAPATGIRRENELVPKHVTISPQAFLKFFSL